MQSLLFRGVTSNVTTVIQYKDDTERDQKLELLVQSGNLLGMDHAKIVYYLLIGYRHVAINYQTVFELTEVDDEEPPTGPSAS